jgi:rhodanese-related sulfurtransferase
LLPVSDLAVWYEYPVPPATTLRKLDVDTALATVDDGAAFIDLRPIPDYLDVHIPGSLALLYEFGPGMAGRARDCLPLELALILLEDGATPLPHAAAALRAKGFTVLGAVADGINEWAARRGTPASTEVLQASSPPAGTVLDVGDPGALPPPGVLRIPVEKLWTRVAHLPSEDPVALVGGRGVRAALAVGILERAGRPEIVVWQPDAGHR